jgi:penicillin-binding protein 2
LPFDKYAAVTLRLPEMPGVAPLRGFSRFYPEGAAVGHLVGYVGIANKDEYQKEKNPLLITPGFKIGKEGLEEVMEPRLRGRPGAKRLEVTARGKLIRELSTLNDQSGGTLPLTIDAGLQAYAARRMGNESGSCVVMDCWTGDILCMASMPAYDPNSFSDGIGQSEWKMLSANERKPLLNKTLNSLYPPGSTLKPMMALALQAGGIDPKADDILRRRLPARQPLLPLPRSPRRRQHAPCHRQELQQLLLRDEPPHRHRQDGRDRAADDARQEI